jgi:hypothetical protein
VNVSDRLHRLTDLLERVRRNGSRPRSEPEAAESDGETLGAVESPTLVAAAPPLAPERPRATLDFDDLALTPVPPAVRLEVTVPEPPSLAEPVSGEQPVVAEQSYDDGDADELDGEPAAVVELGDEEVVDIDMSEIEEVDDFAEPVAEAPPSSSRRPKVPSNMDEALASAAEELDDREVPLKTPPPESGRQIAIPAAGEFRHSHPPVDLVQEAKLEQRLEPAPFAMDEPGSQRFVSESPTAEQIGQTVELRDENGPVLELGAPAALELAPSVPEDLEAAIPVGVAVSAYAADLAPPSRAREDLERHRGFVAPHIAEVPIVEPYATDARASIGRATTVAAAPVAVVIAAPEVRPRTFVELLDMALELGRD